MDFPSVSIIVAAYNEEKRIERCIRSILDLEYPKEKIEIIVVDDGSEDGTADIACKYDATLLRQSHLGCASSRNRAARCAQNGIIAFIDADDICKKEWLKELVPYMNDKRIAASGCTHDLLNEKSNDFVVISHKEKCFRHIKSPVKTDHLGTSGSAIRKEVFYEVGGFSPEFSAAEDTELSHKIRKKGYEIVLVKKPLIDVTYPDTLSKYFLTQIRNSAFLVYFLLKNVERVSGNRYSGLHDYVQSLFPAFLILSLLGNLWILGSLWITILAITLFISSLILVNAEFLRYLRSHRDELSKCWSMSALFYLIIRSVAWNVGLLCGVSLRCLRSLKGNRKSCYSYQILNMQLPIPNFN